MSRPIQEPPAAARAPLPPWRAWRPLWARRERLRGRLLHVAAVLVVIAGTLAIYELALRVAALRGASAWDPATALDLAIPALPWTLLVYLTLYLYYPFAGLAAPRDDRGRLMLLAHAQAMLLLAATSAAFFLIFPARVHVRAEMEALRAEMPWWLDGLYGVLHTLDAPWNAWPSLHVSQSLLVVLTVEEWLWRDRRDLRARLGRAGAWCAWLLLAASILTTRQHFLFDLASGALAGALFWALLLGPALRSMRALSAGEVRARAASLEPRGVARRRAGGGRLAGPGRGW